MLACVRTDEGFLEWLRGTARTLGKVSVRRMFGGHGVYIDGLFVANVDEGRAWFKADA
jgi:DNA transformation protein